ncbi:MAG: benzoate/H(+) symporter BenE family transporter [Pseudomonadota bacterium]|nr:benzoate/H(+) symporter BenE family transporter [Pseudomonadota bacterium]
MSQAAARRHTLRQAWADFGPLYATNGIIGMLFATTGPIAIILSVGTAGHLTAAELASWIFGIFFFNGIITIAMSWTYRQPLCFFWTIPGTVLVGPSLQHLAFGEVIGAYYLTGLLILVLGASGWVKRAMQAVPMPIVMGMVAGVFLRFGLDLIRALEADTALAVPMVLTFLLLAAIPTLGRRLPPLIGALLVGAACVGLLGRVGGAAFDGVQIIHPMLLAPIWSLPAAIELVIPLAITVLVVQNGQGFAVLQSAGHKPPMTATTIACGIGSLLAASVGAVSTCLTGPTNALITSSGEPRRHYTAAIFTGLLAILFSLVAPTFTRLMLATPREFIMMLGGLAMLRVLQAAFVASFRGKFTLGALVSLLVTVADITVGNIGAAFWGLIAGLLVAWLLERSDFAPA